MDSATGVRLHYSSFLQSIPAGRRTPAGAGGPLTGPQRTESNVNAMRPIHQGMAWRAIILTVLLSATAACSDATGPEAAIRRIALAARDGAQPALFVQDLDGMARSRIHFDGAADDVVGNLPPFLLPVRDASIRAFGPVRWSADGTRLAAVVAVAFDQSQVVIMNADGSDKRTVSPNTQIILSDAAWSPDGSHVAYIMSTAALAGAPDLFITKIATSDVTRLTEDGDLGVGVALAWSASGDAVIWSEITDTGPAPLFQRLSTINRIDIETGARSTLAENVPGQVYGLSTDGEFALLVRRVADAGPQFLEDVVVRRLVGGQETVLNDIAEPIDWVSLTGGEESVLIATAVSGGGLRYRLIGTDSTGETVLESVETAATFVDVAPGR